MVTGVILCAQAGAKNTGTPGATGARFRKGLAIAILGGVLAPTLNFGIQYGISLLGPGASGQGGDPFLVRTYLAWAVFLSASAFVQAGYCLSRVLANKSAAAFRSPGALRDALQVFAMSSVWISSVFIYGRSAYGLGRLGISLGWPVFIALIILASNAWGIFLGEWKEKSPFRRMLLGCAVLVVAAFLFGQGNSGAWR